MSNKRHIVVKKIANICRKNQNRIATQLLLNITKDRQVEKKIQRRICQLKTNYCCCVFSLSFATSAFDLFLSNSSFSSSFSFSFSFSFSVSVSFSFSSSNSSSSFNSSFSSSFSSFSFSNSSSFDLFAFVLSTKNLSTKDLLID